MTAPQPEMETVCLTLEDDAKTALDTFQRLLVRWKNSREHDAPAGHPLGSASLWKELVDGDWHLLNGLSEEPNASLLGLVGAAESWGYELGKLPWVSTALLARWMGPSFASPAGQPSRLEGAATFAIPYPDGRLLIPYGDTAHLLVFQPDGGWSAAEVSAGDVLKADEFAPTLPLLMCKTKWNASLPVQAAREAAVTFCATAVGCATCSLERAIAYSKERIAYGRPIGSFQAIKHLLADMYRDAQIARSSVIGAIYDKQWVELLDVCLDLAQQVSAKAIQVHGGLGFTWEAGLHFQLRHIMAVRKILNALAGQGAR